MKEILIKTMIPILFLTIAEIVFFVWMGVKDVQDSMTQKISNAISKVDKNNYLSKIPNSIVDTIDGINKRMYNCKKKERELHNSQLVAKGIFMCLCLTIIIVLLLIFYTPDISWAEWIISTIIETIILMGLVVTFQLVFLYQIMKGGYSYMTNSELKYRIYNSLLKSKTSTL